MSLFVLVSVYSLFGLITACLWAYEFGREYVTPLDDDAGFACLLGVFWPMSLPFFVIYQVLKLGHKTRAK